MIFTEAQRALDIKRSVIRLGTDENTDGTIVQILPNHWALENDRGIMKFGPRENLSISIILLFKTMNIFFSVLVIINCLLDEILQLT